MRSCDCLLSNAVTPVQDAFFRSIFAGPQDPYLLLRIRREHLIRDALTQVRYT